MFSQLSSINGEFLFAHTSNGLYILDPINGSVILWNDEFSIAEAHVINNEIYLITQTGKFQCLTLCTVDSLIVTLYDKKLYEDCLQISTTFRSQTLKSLTENESNQSEFSDSNPSHKFGITEILPLISVLRSNLNQPKKLESGIVLVNSGSLKNSPEPCLKTSPEVSGNERREDEEDFYNDLEFSSDEIVADGEERKRDDENEKKENEDNREVNLHEMMCNLQTELKPLHRLVESLKSSEEEEIEQILIKVADMIKEIKLR